MAEVFMRYVLADDEKPRANVDVHVVTEGGKKGIARFWDTTGMWLTKDKSFNRTDTVKKWRYADAT